MNKLSQHAIAFAVMGLAACASTTGPSETAVAEPIPAYPAVQDEAAFKGLFKELVEINTTASEGSCTAAAEAMKARLVAAGLPESDMTIIAKEGWPQDGNLIVDYPGADASKKPLLLLAHIDVVEAKPEDWVRDPFKLTEDDGIYYGRGVIDDKAMASIWVDTLIRFKQEGYTPDRPVKMALTCGEEGVKERIGLKYLVDEHFDLIDSEFALNEGGGGYLDGASGQYVFNGVQAGEKLYQDYKLEITNPGGHSSRPLPDNAIYRLSAALTEVSKMDFPVEFNDATRNFFTKMADIRGGDFGAAMKAAAEKQDEQAIALLKSDPSTNSILHTTCVATMVDAGHAPNALPQRATANVNCRIFPGHSPEDIRQDLVKTIGDDGIEVTFADDPETAAPPPALTPEILASIEAITEAMYPGVPVVATMASGATDGRFLIPVGIQTYGVSGIFSDPTKANAHGLNERVTVKSLMEGREFLYRLVKAYTEGA